ncbi:MAG: TA system VapC family ribonuclease toxin [Terracidiphilus sp.]
MKSLIFPDVNVWLALNYEKHIHNRVVVEWYETLVHATIFVFCRHTQMGLFRVLSMEPVMKQDSMSQAQCWEVYDHWIDSGLAFVAQEPPGLESCMRERTQEKLVSPKVWADAYLGAFAEAGNLTLVTFDRALAGRVKGAVLLG